MLPTNIAHAICVGEIIFADGFSAFSTAGKRSSFGASVLDWVPKDVVFASLAGAPIVNASNFVPQLTQKLMLSSSMVLHCGHV
jgi:hypothetical protein